MTKTETFPVENRAETDNVAVNAETNLTMPEDSTKQLDMIYTINDVPPWYLCLLLGFQHYLTMFGATIAMPLILAPALCVTEAVHTSEIISTCFFVSGIITLLQVTFGVRLPIIQGGTFAFLTPVFAILSLPQWSCPTAETGGNNTDYNITNTTQAPDDDDDDGASVLWMSRMREIQGAIILASLAQVVIGFSGLIGFLLRFIGPLVIAPTVALIGLSLFKAASGFCASNWWIALATMIFMIIFSQYLRNVNFPFLMYKKGKGVKCSGYPLFKLFPIILAIIVSWALCGILTATNAFPNDKNHWAYGARTDTKTAVLAEAKWFRFPYPGQWGVPTFSVAAVFGMMSGVLAGMIESIGDYYACARLSGAPPPPVHAINRGILFEGLGCIIAGLFGTGTGTTSYSENIGAIGITKVGSTRVIQFGGGLMVLMGMLGKFGALFVTIPEPIVGGIFMVMFSMISAVGISNLQFVDMNSSRNLFIFGFSLFFGLSLPEWMNSQENSGVINTGNSAVDQIIVVLLSTSMFVGGSVAFILDNTVPGTKEERGMVVWKKQLEHPTTNDIHQDKFNCYDLPFGMSYIRKWNWTKYIPLCPTFTGLCNSNSRTDLKEHGVDKENNTVEMTGVDNEKFNIQDEESVAVVIADANKGTLHDNDTLHHRGSVGSSEADPTTRL